MSSHHVPGLQQLSHSTRTCRSLEDCGFPYLIRPTGISVSDQTLPRKTAEKRLVVDGKGNLGPFVSLAEPRKFFVCACVLAG